MALYYYSKYVATPVYTYSNPGSFVYFGQYAGQTSGYTGYSWSSSTGYSTTGSLSSAQGVDLYNVGPNKIICGKSINWYDNTNYYYQATCTKTLTSYTQGSLIQAGIIAEDGTYPDDDEQDGYWWVKGGLAESGNFLALF